MPTDDRAFSDEELSGPKIDRRTSMKLLSLAGMTALAGCSGGPPTETETEADGNDDDTPMDTGTPTDAQTPSQDKIGGSLEAAWLLEELNELDPPYIDHSFNMAAMVNFVNAPLKVNENNEIVGDAATDWTVDGTTFTFELRDDVTFHNGDAATANDIEFAVRRVLEDELPAAANLSELKPLDDGGVNVVDDYTIEFNWQNPFAPGLAFLTRRGRAAVYISERALNEMGREEFALRPVSTGPFAVTGHSVEESVTLTRHEDYHETDAEGNSLPYLDEVVIRLVPEVSTATSGVQGGDIDLLQSVPPQSLEQLQSADGINTSSRALQAWRGLEMNMTREPFDDPQFRKGIAKLLDQEAFIETALFNVGEPAQGPLAKGLYPAREDKPSTQEYAPEEGAQLIRDAGYEGVEFSIMARPSELRMSRTARQLLNESGVVNVELNQVTGGEFGQRIDAMNFDTWIGGAGHSVDPDSSLYNFYVAGGIWNWTGYENEQTEEMLNEQRTIMDTEERAELLWDIEDRVMDHAPHAFTHHQAGTVAWQDYVRGWEHVPGLRPFHTVWLDE